MDVFVDKNSFDPLPTMARFLYCNGHASQNTIRCHYTLALAQSPMYKQLVMSCSVAKYKGFMNSGAPTINVLLKRDMTTKKCI